MAAADYRYYIIDDSKLDCTIASRIVRAAGVPEGQIRSVLLATEALNELATLAAEQGGQPIIVFVDVRMPVMGGFEFVEAFELLPAPVQEACILFMLSSSINESDITRAHSYRTVLDFLNKPLTVAGVHNVAAVVCKHLVDGGRITSA